MKNYSILCSFLFIVHFANAQDTIAVADLQQINTAAKNQFTPVETLDKLQHDLKYFDTHPVNKDQEQLLLDTYRKIADGYSANNHYKQGYGVYQKLLSLKETFLSAEKSTSLAKANSHIAELQHKDEDELLRVQNEIQQLQMDNENLQAKRVSFKKYFSFIIVALTIVFAFLLLQAGLQLNKIKQELNTGRARLKTIHRIATLGQLKKGILVSVSIALSSIRKLSEESGAQLDQLSHGEKNTDLGNLRKQMTELKKIS